MRQAFNQKSEIRNQKTIMLAKRIIPCLDVRDGRVVKGVHFVGLRDAGDAVEQAKIYDAAGADELVFLDISATPDGRATVAPMVRAVADQIFLPLTVGGGIRTVEDMRNILLAGADKVSVNSAAVKAPELLTQGAERFGSQCVVVAIDAKRLTADDDSPRSEAEPGGRWTTVVFRPSAVVSSTLASKTAFTICSSCRWAMSGSA